MSDFIELGYKALEEDDINAANKYFLKAVKKNPNDSSILSTYITFNMKIGKINIAKQYMQDLFKTEKLNVEYYSLYGSILSHEEDMEGAMEAYEMSIKMDPTYTPAYAGMIDVLVDQDDIYNARKISEICMSFGEDVYAYRGIATVRRAEGKYDEAVSWYRKIQKLDRDEQINAVFKIGEVYLDAKKPRLALKHFKQSKNYKYINFYIGKALSDMKKYKEALDYLSVFQDDVEVEAHKGGCYIQLGDNNKALKCFKKMIKIEPKKSIGYDLITGIYLKTGDYKNTLKYSNMGLKIDRNWGILYLRKIHAFVYTGKIQSALDVIIQMTAQFGDVSYLDQNSLDNIKQIDYVVLIQYLLSFLLKYMEIYPPSVVGDSMKLSGD